MRVAVLSDAVVLILEDETLIAIDIEDTLQQVGYRDLVSIGTILQAQEWLNERTPDIAIVDPILRDGTCVDVVRILVNRHVPLIIHSGERPQDTDAEYRLFGGTWIVKPSRPEELIEAIKRGLEAAANSWPRDEARRQ